MPYGSRPYGWSTTNAEPPALGEARIDSTASRLWISDEDANAVDTSLILGALLAENVIRIREVQDPASFQTYEVTGSTTAKTGYHEIPVALSTRLPSGDPIKNNRATDVVFASEQSVALTYASPDDLAAALRVAVSPKNSDLLAKSVAAASAEIDHQCGRDPLDPIPGDDPLAHMVCIARGVEWYKANDVAYGVVGFDATGVLAAPRDGFGRHAADLVPLIQSFGIA